MNVMYWESAIVAFSRGHNDSQMPGFLMKEKIVVGESGDELDKKILNTLEAIKEIKLSCWRPHGRITC